MKKQVFVIFLAGIILSIPCFSDAKYFEDNIANKEIGIFFDKQNNSKKINRDKFIFKKALDHRKKLGTDLLALIDDQFLQPSQSHSQLKELMKKNGQLIEKNDSLMRINRGLSKKEHEDLVYVYLRYLKETKKLGSLIFDIVDQEKNNKIKAVLVEVGKLEELSSLSEVSSISSVMSPIIRAGSVVTEGDEIHQSDEVRNLYSQSGSGVKIGVISDGVDSIVDAKVSGDLPIDVTVLSNSVGGDEGTAMLEIIHDMVPDAELLFHDCGNNVIAFNLAINDLVVAGADIIVDDIGWLTEPSFEDGIVASYIDSVLQLNDIIYVSSAGNDAQRHYQGDFYDDGSGYHDFSESSITDDYLYVNIPNDGDVIVVLNWNEFSGSSSNDHDLFLSNTDDDEVLASSEFLQDGNDNPIEYFIYTNTTGSAIDARIDILNNSALSNNLEIFIYPDNGSYVYANNINAEDSIYGHPAVEGVIATGAISASDPGNDSIESFSSQGPVTIVGEDQRSKPDVSGIDGVSVTGAGGFPSLFYGTSASAPHVAAIAAQLWGQYPSFEGNEIKSYLLDSSVDLGLVGRDNVFGYGRADALLAFQSAPEIPEESLSSPVYRFYSPQNKSHFFTISESEKNKVITTYSSDWNYEGVAYHAYSSSDSELKPVYRFYSPQNKSHFFTISESERNKVLIRYSSDWNYEGIAYHAYSSSDSDLKPVYRFYSPQNKSHFFTISESEKNNVMTTYSSDWDYEGIAWYVPNN